MTLKAKRVLVAEQDCPATGVIGRLPPCPPPPPRVPRGDRARRLPGFDPPKMTRGRSCLRASFCSGGSSAISDGIGRRGWRLPVSRRSVPPARPCAVSAAPPAVRRCAARRSVGLSGGCRETPAGRRRCRRGGGTPFPAPRAPRHGNVAVRAPCVLAGRRAPCRCVAERATALKASVSLARAWM